MCRPPTMSERERTPRWADARCIESNREPMHAPLHPHATVEAALSIAPGRKPTSPWVISLTPSTMMFNLSPSASEAPIVRPAIGFDTSDAGWQDTHVPSSWQMDPDVDERPMYTNVRYAIPGLETAEVLREFPVPRGNDNPVGSYQTSFELPAAWNGRRILLRLDGAEPNVMVWVNGIEIGYGQDSRLPSEFDVTAACATRSLDSRGRGHDDVSGVHVLSLQIVRWCDGSYLEDQDAWSMSGLHRHVWVYSKPAELSLVDYAFVTTDIARAQDTSTAIKARLEVRCNYSQAHVVDGASLIASLHGPCLLIPGEDPPARPEIWRAEQSVGAIISSASVSKEDCEAANWAHGVELAEAGGLLTGSAGCVFEVELTSASLWSAETPHLYTLVLELRSAEGELLDCESSWVGLRTVATIEGLLCVNGRPITLRGVNRHDHCPTRGKAIDWQIMLRDAYLIKSHSLNSVRTSHYPNDSTWLELCDAVGLYVVDEANLETHGCLFVGDEGYLAKQRSWRRAFLSRLSRMVQRDKNHACIVTWSLGNEAGYGGNFEAMAAWARLHDPSRPVQYESGGGTTCTDIVCPMYPNEQMLRTLNTPKGQLLSAWKLGDGYNPTRTYPDSTYTSGMRPVIVCEYAHAMGNSSGNLQEWWQLYRELPYCQGGFVWDWCDQGIAQPVPGRPQASRWAYGGDHGERMHDGRFCINGLVGPDRRPHPALHEVKHVMQPIAALLCKFGYEAADAAGSRAIAVGRVRVSNLNTFVSLDRISIDVRLEIDGVMVASTQLSRTDWNPPAPNESSMLKFRMQLVTAKATAAAQGLSNPFLPREAFLTLTFRHTAAVAWSGYDDQAMRCVAREQFPVPPPTPAVMAAMHRPVPPSSSSSSGGIVRCVELADRFIVHGRVGSDRQAIELTISKTDGTLGPYVFGGRLLLEEGGGELHLHRAPTENDGASTAVTLCNPQEEAERAMVRWYRWMCTCLRPRALTPSGPQCPLSIQLTGDVMRCRESADDGTTMAIPARLLACRPVEARRPPRPRAACLLGERVG